MRLIALLVLVLSTSLAVLAQQRFDFKVREDMFAGMDGDTAAFDRAMKLITDTLAADPDHAEALVWRGPRVRSRVLRPFSAAPWRRAGA